MNQSKGSGVAAERPSHPQEILDDESMGDKEKLDYLTDWRLDLVEQQTATEENMAAGTAAADDDTGEQLRRVTEAIASLQARH